jgi:hypothetical protein
VDYNAASREFRPGQLDYVAIRQLISGAMVRFSLRRYSTFAIVAWRIQSFQTPPNCFQTSVNRRCSIFPPVRRVLVGMRDLLGHDHDDIATHDRVPSKSRSPRYRVPASRPPDAFAQRGPQRRADRSPLRRKPFLLPGAWFLFDGGLRCPRVTKVPCG